MNIENIKNELVNMGFYAEVTSKISNGIERMGIKVSRTKGQSIWPVFYPETYIDENDEEDKKDKKAAKRIAESYERIESSGSLSAHTAVVTKDYILDSIRLGLQRPFGEEILRRPSKDFEGLEEYLYLFVEDGHMKSTAKVVPGLCENYGVTEEEAWDTALKNTADDALISTMAEQLGFPVETSSPMYVVTTHNQYRGAAAAVAAKDKILSFARENGAESVLLLPSSIHEFIAVLDGDKIQGMEDFVKMVTYINSDEDIINPMDKLVDNAYLWKVN